jgi:hypothetical protein
MGDIGQVPTIKSHGEGREERFMGKGSEQYAIRTTKKEQTWSEHTTREQVLRYDICHG